MQKNLKLALSSAMFAGAVMASSMASATVIAFGNVPVSPSAPLAFSETHSAGAFSDTISFSLVTGSLESSASSLKLSLGATTVFDIANLSYSLYSANGDQIGGVYNGNNTTYTNLLTAGSYFFKVTGTATGSAGGVYGMSMLTAAVPEPETYGMMLGGLGLIGFVAARRKANKAG
jgi:PEP-CTERM motif